MNFRESKPSLSIVIASYNSAPWLPSTLSSAARSLALSTWDAEVVVVDDGSTDSTATVLAHIKETFPVPLKILAQVNKGRFLARYEGVRSATHDIILILDSRLIVHENAFRYLQQSLEQDPSATVWNGHVGTDPSAPLVGHFWSVPTYLFWGDYLSNPKLTQITVDNFDRVPKGTGFLVIPKNLFLEACLDAWPTENAHLTSDDTKLLRYVVVQTPIRLDPGFSATYRPRTAIRPFLSHSWGRGTLFVDSYAGTSGIRNAVLISLGIVPPLSLIAITWLAIAGQWPALWTLLAVVVALILVPMLIAAVRRCPRRALVSYLAFIVPFGAAFWFGLVRGLIVHRKSFSRREQQEEETTG